MTGVQVQGQSRLVVQLPSGSSQQILLGTQVAAESIRAQAAEAAILAASVSKTPTAGNYTYTNGNVTQDPDGIIYAYNADGTLHTETVPQPGGGTITRTYNYNTDGTIASVS